MQSMCVDSGLCAHPSPSSIYIDHLDELKLNTKMVTAKYLTFGGNLSAGVGRSRIFGDYLERLASPVYVYHASPPQFTSFPTNNSFGNFRRCKKLP